MPGTAVPVIAPSTATALPRGGTSIEIVIPVYNEERALEDSVRALRAYLDEAFPLPARIAIADNASTDGTWDVASRLAAQISGVRALHLDQKGRGRALRAAWMTSDADIVAYMDVDLSTRLDALLPLVAPLISGHSDIAIGSRLAPGSRVVRGPRREMISRIYNLVVRATLHNGFRDAQCGFKALRTDVAHRLLPDVEDQAWFFDTELLVLAEHKGLRVHEVPVDWVDDPNSSVDVVRTAVADLKGIWRLVRKGGGASPASRFARIGGASTVAYLVLLCLLRIPFGSLLANLVALSACTLANVAAHRRAAVTAGHPVPRVLVTGVASWAGGVALSTVGILIAGAVAPHSLLADLVAVLAANSVVSGLRLLALRAHDPTLIR